MLKRSYEVAGYRFSFFMEESDPLWEQISQYEPFFTDNLEDGDEVFILQKVKNLPDYSDCAVPVCGDDDTKDDDPRVEVYRIPYGYEFRFSPTPDGPVVGRMTCGENFRRGIFCCDSCQMFVLNCSAMILFAMSTAGKDTVLMHSSVTVKGRKAYMFLGESGAGKSTHSMMWRKAFKGRARLLNDDNPVVRIGKDGTVAAYGSPWSGKTPCYVQDSAPVAGFAHIVKAPENRYTRLTPFDAYLRLLPACSCIWQIDELNEGVSGTVEKICESIPSIVLECLPDGKAAKVCEKALAVTP